jgi:hypothetical protein
MFGFRLMVRLGSAALRWLQPHVRLSCSRPSRTRLSFESLSDRILPSVDLTHINLSQEFADPDAAQVRFVEIPQSESWRPYLDSQEFPISPQQMSDILGGASRLEQLGTPSVTGGTVELGGETIPTVVLQFGSSVTIDLVFGEDVAGSADDPGSAADSRSAFLGGFVEVCLNGGERRFLMDHIGVEPSWQGTPSLPEVHSLAKNAGEGSPTQLAHGPRPTIAGIEPTNTSPSAAATGSPLATFLAGWSGGKQVGGELAAQAADDVWVNRAAEIAVNDPGNPADVLFTLDTVLPDAKPDLVRLQNADLAIVPTYLVGDGPVSPVAPPRVDEQSDPGLTTHVVGLEEWPGGVSHPPFSTDRPFELAASADGGRAVEACRLGARIQQGEIEVGDALHAAPTDVGCALREWLDGLLNQSGNAAEVVAALALEELLVAVYRRRLAGRAVSPDFPRPDAGSLTPSART